MTSTYKHLSDCELEANLLKVLQKKLCNLNKTTKSKQKNDEHATHAVIPSVQGTELQAANPAQRIHITAPAQQVTNFNN